MQHWRSANSIYRDIQFKINDQTIKNIIPLVRKNEIEIKPDNKGLVKIYLTYKATGMGQIVYFISSEGNEISQFNNFNLKIVTDFNNYDFPSNMMSPTIKNKLKKGYELIWSLNNSVTGKNIGLIIPNKLNPGEIVTRVDFFAPVSLLFFFVVILILTLVLKISLHPMHYLFLAASFFAFHLMYSYFSDNLNLYVTFGISSLVSLILTITYLRLFTPKIMYLIYAPIIQFIYLIIFFILVFF